MRRLLFSLESHDTQPASALPSLPLAYLRGMKREECVAPMPGRPCFTGLYVMLYSPV